MRKLTLLIGLVVSNLALADTLSFSGAITQSPNDALATASNNPSLNNVNDGDSYAVTLTFAGAISGPGTFDLLGGPFVFLDTTASVTEKAFSSESLTLTPDGSAFDLSLLGCLSTGSGCLLGNFLSANFLIPAASIHSANVIAQAVTGLTPPLDLLEDDGVTEVQGSIGSYSYSGSVSPVPEPSETIPSIIGLAGLWLMRRRLRASQPGTKSEHQCLAVTALVSRPRPLTRATKSEGEKQSMNKRILILLAFALAPICAFAVDGVTLINQSTVLASGGFPYKITEAGSYQLSGNLIPPAGTQAIVVLASNVVLDLNGFNVSCVFGLNTLPTIPHHPINFNCIGDSGTTFPSGISDVTILNGTVTLTQTEQPSNGANVAVGFFATPNVIAEKLHVEAINTGVSGVVLGLAFGVNSIIRHNILSGSTGSSNGVAETCPSILEGNINTQFNAGGNGCVLINNIGGFN